MTLDADELIRRFLLYALADGCHRIRYYGFLANGRRGDNIALCPRCSMPITRRLISDRRAATPKAID
jgi:hypothetical protein